MNTKELSLAENRAEAIAEAGAILRQGGLVAIPTETVYGLAADAFQPDAVDRIFLAKGRPQDNPLIVHIAEKSQLSRVAASVPPLASCLMDAFWPGPLTLVLPKAEAVPPNISVGLDTVAVRFPSNPDTLDIIRAAGSPLAAPSANLSGSPSPTRAEHVLQDLRGRIEAVVVSEGLCAVGLESTVVDVTGEVPVLLRPGAITPEMLAAVAGEIEISDGVLRALPEGAKAASPGMKYRHYAPHMQVVLLRGSDAQVLSFLQAQQGREKVLALCYRGEEQQIPLPTVVYGTAGHPQEQARELFDALRRIDRMDVDVVYARCPEPQGMGLALYNRLIRAAGFEVLELGM